MTVNVASGPLSIAKLASVPLAAVYVLGAAPIPPRPATETPLLNDFADFCVDAKLDMNLAVMAARRLSLDVHTLPRRPVPARTPGAMWLHQVKAHTIATSYVFEKWRRDSPVQSPFCVVQDPADAGLSIAAIDKWLGTPSTNGRVSIYKFALTPEGARRIADSSSEEIQAAKAAGNFYVLVVRAFNGATSLTLGHWRG